jgi:hypothetical protein
MKIIMSHSQTPEGLLVGIRRLEQRCPGYFFFFFFTLVLLLYILEPIAERREAWVRKLGGGRDSLLVSRKGWSCPFCCPQCSGLS